jgi:hypothetical protein
MRENKKTQSKMAEEERAHDELEMRKKAGHT